MADDAKAAAAPPEGKEEQSTAAVENTKVTNELRLTVDAVLDRYVSVPTTTPTNKI